MLSVPVPHSFSSVVSRTKPKRWNTFKNAFRIPQRQKAQNPSSSKGRKSIIGRLKLRRHKVPAPLNLPKDSSREPQLHNRPLSLNEDEIPTDTLEALLDVMPSRSLPATPLTKKRADHLNLSPPDSPIFDNPPSTPSTPPASVTTVPAIEIHHSPPVEKTIENGFEEPSASNNQEQPAIIIVETPAAPVTPAASTVEPEQVSAAEMAISSEVQKILQQEYTWDRIREVLQEADNHGDNVSYDILPKQDDQEWLQHSNGVDQLRAFLAVCD